MAMESYAQDLRYGIRNLARTPGLAAVAVLSLALGIGSATAIYSVVYGVILDPFPYRDVDRLISINVRDSAGRGYGGGYSVDQFLDIAEKNSVFEYTIASTISDVVWTGGVEPQRLRGNHGTGDTFLCMGVPPLIGRFYTPSDTRDGAEPVVVLGYRFWQRQFAGDPEVIGRKLRLNDIERTVVGVMPPRFMWRGADVYIPLRLLRGQTVEGVRDVHLLGRLKAGVTFPQAEADLRPLLEDIFRNDPRFPRQWRIELKTFRETFPSSLRKPLWILLGAVGLLLLIACANVSNLLLSRATARQKEMAVRVALGAARVRLIRQLLTESLGLALVGGLLGCLFAWGSLKTILALVPPYTIPDESEVALNWPVLGFSLLVCVLTSVIFGLAPALITSGRNVANPLKEAGRSSTGGGQGWLRNGLVVVEVALSVLLLVGAGLVMRSLLAMRSVDLGFRTEHVITFRVPFSEKRYPDKERKFAFLRDALERIQSVPGVLSAGVNTGFHPAGNWGAPVVVPGGLIQDSSRVALHQANSGYLRTMSIDLIEGRLFDDREVNTVQHVALVNQAFVDRYIGQGAVGRSFQIPRLRQAPFNIEDDSFQIIGVVQNARIGNFQFEFGPEMYLPYTLTGFANQIVVKASVDPAAILKPVQAQIYAIDKDQPVMDIRTIDRALQDFILAGPQFLLVLFGVFAALGLTLAAIGVYGVMAHNVERRTQEIGLRMALGAASSRILRMVLTGGLWLLGIGVILGLAGSWAASRVLKNFLWHVSPVDPIAFSVVAAVLLVVGLTACLRPAARAARIAPVEALRYE